MPESVETQIDKIIVNTEEKLLAVVTTSLDEMINDMQTPAPAGKMRVKTGFLWSSGLGQINQIPSGPSRGDPNRTYSWNGEALALVLAKMKIGDTFYWGWSANYAKYREVFDGFMDSAIQKWPQYVRTNVNKLRKK